MRYISATGGRVYLQGNGIECVMAQLMVSGKRADGQSGGDADDKEASALDARDLRPKAAIGETLSRSRWLRKRLRHCQRIAELP
jgi:hypothetical protein